MSDTLQQFDALQHYAPLRAMIPTINSGDYVRADEARKIVEAQAAAIAELNARLEERAQDHIKASDRDVAEIQRLRVEMDALKRRVVKPLVWVETHISPNNRRIQAQGTACLYRVHAKDGNVMLRVSSKRESAVYAADSINNAKRIAEDLHREAVLALLETEEKTSVHGLVATHTGDGWLLQRLETDGTYTPEDGLAWPEDWPVAVTATWLKERGVEVQA